MRLWESRGKAAKGLRVGAEKTVESTWSWWRERKPEFSWKVRMSNRCEPMAMQIRGDRELVRKMPKGMLERVKSELAGMGRKDVIVEAVY
jgi:hypothetical protein